MGNKSNNKKSLENLLNEKVERIISSENTIRKNISLNYMLPIIGGFLLLSTIALSSRGCRQKKQEVNNQAYTNVVERVYTNVVDRFYTNVVERVVSQTVDNVSIVQKPDDIVVDTNNLKLAELNDSLIRKNTEAELNRRLYLEVQEKREFDSKLDETRNLFNNNELENSYIHLNKLIIRLENNSHFSFAHQSIIDLLEWKEDVVLPSLVESRIESINLQDDYRIRKNSLDDLSKFITNQRFNGKDNVISTINEIHNKGINIEKEILALFKQRFDSIVQNFDNNLYVTAHNNAKILLKDINSFNLVYENNNLSKFSDEFSKYFNKNINRMYNKRNVLVENSNNNFIKYNKLLNEGIIQNNLDITKHLSRRAYPGQGFELPYLEAKNELETIIKKQIILTEDKEIVVKANLLLNKIKQKIDFLKDAYVNYFKSEKEKWANLVLLRNRHASNFERNIQRQFNDFKKSDIYSLFKDDIDKVSTWKTEKLLPDMFQDEFNKIAKNKNRSTRKQSLDNLLSTINSVDFKGKNSFINNIKQLNKSDVQYENNLLLNFNSRFNNVVESVSQKHYVSAHQEVQNILKEIRSEKFLYQSRNAFSLSRKIVNYYNRNIKIEFEKRNLVIQNINSKFIEYNKLLNNGPIQNNLDISLYLDNRLYPGEGLEIPYLKAEKEIQALINEMDILTEHNDKIKQANNYLTKIRQRYDLLVNKINSHFVSESYRWRDLNNKGKVREAIQLNKSLNNQISHFEKSTLYSNKR
jgi:hypothetical protein